MKRRGHIPAVVGLTVVSLFFGFTFGFIAGRVTGERVIQHEAVKAGVARWVVVDASGSTKFEWIVCGETK